MAKSLEWGRSLAWLRLGALVAGVVLIGAGVGLGVLSGREDRAALDRQLVLEARKQTEAVEEYFDRARDILLLEAQNSAFADFYASPGARGDKVAGGDPFLDRAARSLAYLENLYPDRIGEICFIDASGAENARIVGGVRAGLDDLSVDESANPFFAPTFDVGIGQVYQASTYISPDTNDLVISNSTVVPGIPGGQQAMIHFEVTMRSFAELRGGVGIRFLIVDAATGASIADNSESVAFDADATGGDTLELTDLVNSGRDSGVVSVGDQRVAFEHLVSTESNANEWYIIAASPGLDTGLAADLGRRTLVLLGAALALVTFALASFRGYQRRLELAARTDALTSLPNRIMLSGEVEAALARRRNGREVAVLLLDLDGFKEVNDTLGHHSGDQLLTAIGPRIRSVLRDGDTIARLGGDEFAVLLPSVLGVSEALDVANRILARLREPFQVGELAIEVEASIGIAIASQHGNNFTALLQHADAAMYVAKRSGLGVSLYDTSLDSHDPLRLSMLAELRRALDNHELVLYYQPKIALPTEHLFGVEALLRWNHPRRGLVLPDDFIPYAEHTALIHPLTDWVIERAVKDIRSWLDAGRDIPVSINVSARTLHDHRLCDSIAEQLKRYDVPSRLVVIEITETAIMTEPAKARETLVELNAMGVEISIDDFGTGYSSLAYLTTIPVHELKIDRSFVTNMCSHRDAAVIVRSVIDLGRNLGLRVVAEGVEDAETRRHLVDDGCLIAQGYLWSSPLTLDAFQAWLDSRHAAHLAATVVTVG